MAQTVSHRGLAHLRQRSGYRGPVTARLSRERLSGTRALFGRDAERVWLDHAWARRDIGVVTIIAIGGG
jgi:hypothetical protein